MRTRKRGREHQQRDSAADFKEFRTHFELPLHDMDHDRKRFAYFVYVCVCVRACVHACTRFKQGSVWGLECRV